MKKIIYTLGLMSMSLLYSTDAMGQDANPRDNTTSTSHYLIAQPVPDRTLLFNLSDEGVSTPILWGLDTAWPDEYNIRRGVAFMGSENIDIVRASFQPTLPLVNGDLQTDQINWLNTRMNLVNLTNPNAVIVLNCDHPSVDPWYAGNAERWAQLMDVTTRRVQERGRRVVAISPFNEPDYGWGQGSITDFYNIAGELRKNPRFDTIRISGGNTLNCDQALPWYNQLKSRLDEGNTHQLAGSFNSYATFYQTVRANGHHATNDELHNVMEAMVGVEYGMQTGIWWGTAELARGEFVKASKGKRLGYAEHRPNWTAASVYRHPGGKVQAFGGTSERQAVNTSYRFVSKDRDVYYDGYGPQREYTMAMPGGTGYQQGQTNAERVVNVTWGEDIQPVINGQYIVVNRNSEKVMEVTNGSTAAGANVRQNTNTGATFQQWNVTPVSSRIGGDFSYFTFTAVHSAKAIDILNWSLNNGGNIIVWDDAKGGNQQWYLEYAEDGWFYIRSRHSNKCLHVANSSKDNAANIEQRDMNGSHAQQWRFLPVGAVVEFNAPVAPTGLTATASTNSIRLEWLANTESDLSGYTILRSETPGSGYNTIARNVTTTAFVDNTCVPGTTYYYAIKAKDISQNHSEKSLEISATATGANNLVVHYPFNGNVLDSTLHMNHSALLGGFSYIDGKVGTKAIALNGTNTFVQLPYTATHHREISIACWIFWKGGSNWQRIFDFGNSQNEYMFLTPRADNGQIRFGIKNGGVEQQLNAGTLTTSQWVHVTLTLGESGVKIFINGNLANQSTGISINPMDFKPLLNYIGRSQFSDPMLNGNIDDFRIYNYSLSASEVAELAGITSGLKDNQQAAQVNLWPVPARDVLHVQYNTDASHEQSTLSVFDLTGKQLLSKTHRFDYDAELHVGHLPAGVYVLQLSNNKEIVTKRFVITKE